MINTIATFIAALKKSPGQNRRPGQTETLSVGTPYNNEIKGADAVSLLDGQSAPRIFLYFKKDKPYGTFGQGIPT